MRLRRRGNVALEKEGTSFTSYSGSDFAQVFGLVEVGPGSGEDGNVFSAGEDVDSREPAKKEEVEKQRDDEGSREPVEKEEVEKQRDDVGSREPVKKEEVERQKDGVVVMNRRVLRSDVKQRGVRIENGVIQIISDGKKKMGRNGVLLFPEGTLAPSDVEIPDAHDVTVNMENTGEEVHTENKVNAVDGNRRVLRSHFNRKEDHDEKDVALLQVESKQKCSRTVDAVISQERIKVSSDEEVPLVIDGSKVNSKLFEDKKMDCVEHETETQMKKRLLRSHVIKHKESNDIRQPQFERKRIRESLDDGVHGERMATTSDTEVPLKKIKNGSSKYQDGKAKGKKVKKLSDHASRLGNLVETTLDTTLHLVKVEDAGTKSNTVTEKHKNITFDKNSKKHEENIKSKEQSGTRVLRLLRNRNIIPPDSSRADSTIEPKKDQVPRNATPCASKQASVSRARKVISNSSSGDVTGQRYLKGRLQSPNRKNIFKELKREVEDIPAVQGSRKKNLKDSTIVKGSKFKRSSKVKANSSSIRAIKQHLTDQLKGILLNAGWKIDLRPRNGRNYLDSVYIPPDGRGSYWSITKAYVVYQAKLKSAGVETSKEAANRSCGTGGIVGEGSTASSSIVPLESLIILKKKMTKKRRSKVEIEQATKGKKRKAKDIADKVSTKRHGKMKVNNFRRRKVSDDSIGSHTHANVSSSARKQLQSRRNKHLLVRDSNQGAECEGGDYVPYAGKRTVLSWMIDLGVVPINGKVKYVTGSETEVKLEGLVKRDGIQCGCCNKIVSILMFEHHAGGRLFQAYENIHVEGSGVSLMQCQLDAWKKLNASENQGFFAIDITGEDPNDDTCGICGDGGDLICCDSCPSTFHLSCLGIEMLPSGDWNCTNCSCRFCRVAAIYDAKEIDGNSLLSCSQCEKKYHQYCVPEIDSSHTGSNNSGYSFCGQSCRKVFMQLDRLIGTQNDLEKGLSWSLLRRFDDDSSNSLHSVAKKAECNSKIAIAFAVMDECFLPITDQRSGIELIHNVVYNCGSNFSRLNYTGFYTFVLERGDEVISAASVRVHGTRLAEMPFIGTRNMYRRQGMARQLLNGIETLLRSLSVEKLVIPAISELRDTWTTSFGFNSPKSSEELEFKSVNLLVFPGIGLLVKPLLENDSSAQYKSVEPELCNRSNQDPRVDFSNESPTVSSIVPDLNVPIKCPSDDFADSGASVSPKSMIDPNQSEVSMPEQKSEKVDECTDIPPSTADLDSFVAEVQPIRVLTDGTCRLLCEVKGTRNNELKIADRCKNLRVFHETLVESTPDSKCINQFCSNSTSLESGTIETEAEVSDLFQLKSKQPQSCFFGSKCHASAELMVIDNLEVNGPASHVISDKGHKHMTVKVDSLARLRPSV